jgi:hypothetical protein
MLEDRRVRGFIVLSAGKKASHMLRSFYGSNVEGAEILQLGEEQCGPGICAPQLQILFPLSLFVQVIAYALYQRTELRDVLLFWSGRVDPIMYLRELDVIDRVCDPWIPKRCTDEWNETVLAVTPFEVDTMVQPGKEEPVEAARDEQQIRLARPEKMILYREQDLVR